MSVVEGSLDFLSKKSLSDADQGRCGGRTRLVLLFVGGVLLAAALTTAVAVITSILYKRSPHEDGFVSYEYLATPHAASKGVLDFQEKTGATGHEELYINDVTREQTIHILHKYYDIFILRKFNEGREMMVVTTKPAEGKPRRMIECDETNMTDTEFVSSSVLLNEPLTNPADVTIEERFQETSQPIKLAYKSCDQIPPAMFKEQECSMPADTVSDVVRTKRHSKGKRDKSTKYGNWGGRWNKHWAFPRCCDGCKDRAQCSSLTCRPPLDSLDMAAMDYTFCTKCWAQTPTDDIPHCDCIRDFMKDIGNLRCSYDKYEDCNFYRSSLRGIMPSHKCWGRLVTKWYQVYHCGYKQTNCSKGKCKIRPEYCVKGKTRVRNNFKCANYLTCEESTRQLSGHSSLMHQFKY